jgi:hypothetical protein
MRPSPCDAPRVGDRHADPVRPRRMGAGRDATLQMMKKSAWVILSFFGMVAIWIAAFEPLPSSS